MSGYLPYLVLAAWVPFSVVAFAVMKPSQAAMLVMLGGMLFLPEVVSFDAPLVPPYGKHEVASTCALFGLLLRCPERLRMPRLGRGADFFLILAGLSGVATVLLNPDVVGYGLVQLPGMHVRDVLAFGIRDYLAIVQPYLVGRMCIQSTRDVRALVRMVLGLGLAYSLLILFELRFSPNLHRWIYGFHARDDFSQTVRWGGYRPTVFMEHGLAVALFAMAVALYAAVQARLRKRHWWLPSWCWTLYFTGIMILCRSTGAILLGVIALAAIVWFSPRKQLQLALAIAAVCLVYPGLRVSKLFPADAIVKFTSQAIAPDRAASLQFRFENEGMLIEHVRKRLWFGWGGYGRNRLYDSDGQNRVITDGYWIILLSAGGVALLYAVFGVMLIPVWSAVRLLRKVPERTDQQLLAGLALIEVCCVFDLLPNGMFNQAPLFYAGALTSLCAAIRLGRGQSQTTLQPAATVFLVTPVA
jgi:hypothetical protein